MSAEQKWLELGRSYANIAHNMLSHGDERYSQAIQQAKDCFRIVKRLRQKRGVRKYLVVC